LHWEDEVVWNGDDIKHKVMSVTLMNIWNKNCKVKWMRFEVLMALNIQTAVNGDVMPCSAVGGYQHLLVLLSRSMQYVSLKCW
jgi:hypothetical protein